MLILKLVRAVTSQVEYIYQWLIGVIIDELIHGERNHDSSTVIKACLIFVVLAIFSFYMELFIELYTFIGITSLIFCQLSNIKTEVTNSTRQEILTGYFHESCMVLFLLVFTSFLPKAGHFIMFWISPSLGIEVPTLMLDLSFSGIWSIFAIDIQFFDVIYLSLFLISLIFSINSWRKSSAP